MHNWDIMPESHGKLEKTMYSEISLKVYMSFGSAVISFLNLSWYQACIRYIYIYVYISITCIFCIFLFWSNMFLGKEYLKKYNNSIMSLHSMFAECHKLIPGNSFPGFGGNFFSENMKIRQYLTLFMLSSTILFVMKWKSTNQNHGKISLNCQIICNEIFSTPHIYIFKLFQQKKDKSNVKTIFSM